MRPSTLLAVLLSLAAASCSEPDDDTVPPWSAWLAQLDAGGDLVWAADVERCWSPSVGLLAPRPEGGWLGVGGGLDGRAVVAALEPNGSLSSRHVLEAGAVVSALAPVDGAIVVALAREAAAPRLLRLGIDGAEVWHHDVYAEGVRVNAITSAPGGGVLAIGATADATGDHDPWVVRLDAQGEPVWETILPSDEDVELLSGTHVGDGIVVAGRRRGPGWETVRMMRLDGEGQIDGEATDLGDLAGASLVAVEVASDGAVALLANQRFESLLFERWSAAPQLRTARFEWPDPWLVGTAMRAGADGDIAVSSPILARSGSERDGTWVRRIDGAGELTVDVRMRDAGYGRAVAIGPEGVMVGGSTRHAYGVERCVR